jgi:outer membrane protein insertion porin family
LKFDRYFRHFIVFIVLVLGLYPFAVNASEELPPIVTDIQITGYEHIDIQTIQYLVKVTPGSMLNRNFIRRDVKNLYATGFFDNIKVQLEELDVGYRLVYVVSERPRLSDVVISGAHSIGLSTLREELTISSGDRYNPSEVQKSITNIEEKYRDKGYHFVTVSPRLTTPRAGLSSLVLDIDEGTKLRIREVNIVGNKNINTGNRLWGLKSQLENNQEWWWLSFITEAGKFRENKLHEDIQAIEEYYKNRGYLRVSVSEPVVTLNPPSRPGKPASLSLTIEIDEGPVYTIGNVDYKVTDESILPVSVVKSVVESVRPETYQRYFGGSAFFGTGSRFQNGHRYSLALEDQAIQTLSEIYGNQGYVYAFVSPERTINDQNRTVDITFSIVEGVQAFLNRLEFRGNYRTKDRVLRRNFTLVEGQVFNTTLLRSSISRLQYLAYIDDVMPEIEPQMDPSLINVEISLADNRQTEIQLAGGYSGYNRLYGTLGLSEHNLFGRGQELSVQATSGERSETIRFSFTDEWVMDRPYYGSFSLWNTREKYDYSTQRKRGASLFTGRTFGRAFSSRIGYTLERNKVYDISPSADDSVKDLEGTQVTSSLTHVWILNTLDSRLDPSKGFYGSASIQYAGGIFGGDNDFFKSALSMSNHWALPRRLVFAVQGRISYADGLRGQELPFYELYRLGGPNTVRGYRDFSIGPIGERGNTLGGNKSVFLSSEIQIPIAQPLKLILFADAGNVWASGDDIDLRTLRPSTGFEVRFFMPGFGIPLRFIWGYNLDPYENESHTDFQFAMGRTF